MLMTGVTSQNAFIESKNTLNLTIRGKSSSVPRCIFQKGYEIFIHYLDYDIEKTWNCNECPVNPS